MPEVFGTADGGFTVVFGVDRSSGTFEDIYRQQFDSTGEKLGPNRLVNVNAADFTEIYARSATLVDGSTITIWNSEGAVDQGPGRIDTNEIRGMLTNPAGAVARADFGLAPNYGSVGNGSGAGYDVTALANGGFAVVKMNFQDDLGIEDDDILFYVVMRLFDANGADVSGPIIVDVSDRLPNEARLVQLDTGAIVVVWQTDDDSPRFVGDTLYGRAFTPAGVPLTDRFDVGDPVASFTDQGDHEITALNGGGFVVSFTSEAIDSDDDGVAAKIFDADFLPVLPDQPPKEGLRQKGSSEAERLEGGTANDTLIGAGGADTLLGAGGEDSLTGGGGRDRLLGGAGSDDLKGGKGRDFLRGDGGSDVLSGGRGADVLRGKAGADRLDGGSGKDTLAGGSGTDTFVFDGTAQQGKDVLKDFEDGVDRIEIAGLTFEDLRISPVQDGTSTRISLDGGTRLVLEGTVSGQIGADDFDFV